MAKKSLCVCLVLCGISMANAFSIDLEETEAPPTEIELPLSTDYKTGNPEYLLYKHLFANYSNVVRPVKRVEEVVPVSFDIGYSQMVNLVEKNQILISNLWVRLKWYDPWLTWNESDFGGMKSIKVDPSCVWVPDIVLYNNVDSDSSGEMYKFTTKVNIHSDGTVQWLSPIQVKSECKIDITNFPLDEQFCKLEFGSWAYDGFELNLTNARETADLSLYTTNGEWRMLSGKVTRKLSKFPCCEAPYITLIYMFHVQRRALFYVMNLIIPCVLLTFLSALTFRFPPESGERVSLTITILLGMTVFMLIFIDNIPPTSEVMPLIGKYFSCSLFIMGSSLIATCMSLSLYYNNAMAPMPVWLRVMAFKFLGPAFGIRPPKHSLDEKFHRDRENSCIQREQENSIRGMENNITENLVPGKQRKSIPNGGRKLEDTLSQSASIPCNMDSSPASLIKVLLAARSAEGVGRGGCCCSRSGAASVSEDTEMSEKKEEWQFVAAVVDRFFFYLFIFVICLCAIVVFFMSPAVRMLFS
ncbi:neuronal acetylcholine receptor subunit alpha-10 isoform X2 [Nematostella vectensis]|uniref:neuronal acetylcholine receptor subunit alpha-10 isoform X2 n=1 Tax=Nematostella vectensis TaxID=45351 RepID=UPI002076EC79|nr:neuronal acetylcholine receptor subunit alpha-10 isoform X2 [Nematostella vectensis]